MCRYFACRAYYIADYEKTQATIKLMSQLAAGENSGREDVKIVPVGCYGFCYAEPMVEVREAGVWRRVGMWQPHVVPRPG